MGMSVVWAADSCAGKWWFCSQIFQPGPLSRSLLFVIAHVNIANIIKTALPLSGNM